MIFKRTILFVVLMGFLVTAATSKAPIIDAKARARLSQLETKESIELTQATKIRLQARDIALEIETLRARLIDLSGSHREIERKNTLYRARLETLYQKDKDISRKLVASRAQISRLLNALQVMKKYPAPALFVPSKDILDSVRVMIMLKHMTPNLKAQADDLKQQSSALTALRRQAALETRALNVTDAALDYGREEIDDLIAKKAEFEEELLKRADRHEAEAILMRTHMTKITLPFGLRGRLGFESNKTNSYFQPVVGEKTIGFGDSLTHPKGVKSRGLYIKTQGGALVRAPFEGVVDYAGPLDSFGQVVIINIGRAHRIVLTGLSQVFIEKGQRVAQQEPIGRMPYANTSHAELYWELRHQEETINPELLLAFRP